ncbi:uncharacterized protein LOC101235355 isoform X1 [Hydra vulgaris]|uniref:Sugar transporter SWEET n=1 Tax=Hydra vulgaris TaxID=6087 RepID=T2M6F9_HYDVU|nr:bidirectional sugar transporter SWEET15 [Hydra vulgaris]
MVDISFFESEVFAVCVQGCALVLTIGYFLTGSITCMKIHHQKSVKNVNFLPYLTAFLNTFLWFVYGSLKKDSLLIFVNSVGCILQAGYIFVFIQNCDKKQHYIKRVFTLGFTCFCVLVVAEFGHIFFDTLLVLAWIACVVSVLMFGSPLSTVREVIRTKNAETISFPLSIMTCLTTISWFIYGSLKHDNFVRFPNALGFILGLSQIYFINKFKNQKLLGTNLNV